MSIRKHLYACLGLDFSLLSVPGGQLPGVKRPLPQQDLGQGQPVSVGKALKGLGRNRQVILAQSACAVHEPCLLMPAWAGDIIPGHSPAGIKASTGETMGKAPWGAKSEGASHAGHE